MNGKGSIIIIQVYIINNKTPHLACNINIVIWICKKFISKNNDGNYNINYCLYNNNHDFSLKILFKKINEANYFMPIVAIMLTILRDFTIIIIEMLFYLVVF